MLDTSIWDFLIKSLLGVLLAYILNETLKFKERIHDLEIKIDTILIKLNDTNNNGELGRIKETLVELKGMVHVLTCYQRIIKPPSGGQT
jgi:hypothetical protein